MNYQGDILIRNQDGNIVASIEIKNTSNYDRNVASNLRRNMFVHGLLKDVPYFLTMSRDKGYLWNNIEQKAEDSQPLLEFSMEKVMDKYVSNKNDYKNKLSSRELELIILRWLLSISELDMEYVKQEPEKSLLEVGFLNSISNGLIASGEEA